MPQITTCLWFDGKALEAAEFYVSVFPNARITDVQRSLVDTPGDGAKTGDLGGSLGTEAFADAVIARMDGAK